MARNFYTPINLNTLEIQNAVVGNLTTTSINALTGGALAKGRIQFDSTANVMKFYDGSAWKTISTGAGSFTLGNTLINLGDTAGAVGSALTGLYLTTPTIGSGAAFSGSTSGTSTLVAQATAGTTTFTLPTTTGTLVGSGDTGTVTNAMLAGSITNAKLSNSTISGVALGSNLFTLTFGTGLTAGGASYNGSSAITITPVSATTSVAGIVQLSDSTSTTSSTVAATSTAAKAAYDRGSTGVTNAATAQTTADAALPKAGGTMTGAIAMGSNKITGLGTPTAAADAATKDYVDNVSAGVNVHDSVVAATTGTIAGVYAAGSTTTNPPGDGGTGVGATITYSATGVVTLDTSVTLAAGDRVLVKDGVTADTGASSKANGIYVVTTAGAVGTAAILTRAADSDNSHFGDLAAGDLVYVIGGNTYAGDQFVQTVKGTATTGSGVSTKYSIKIGTDAISYTQFSGAGAVPNATTTTTGIASFPAAQFSVTSGAVTIDNLDTAKITTGQLSGARGGTGVDNTGKTITLGGNFTTSGGFTTTLVATANTSVTLPTSGTLVNTAVTTLSSLASVGTITTGVWNGTDIAVADGGTGASTAAAARANLGATTKVTNSVALTANTQATINHALGTQAVLVQMFDSSWNLVDMDVVNFDSNNVKVTASVTATFNYVIIG